MEAITLSEIKVYGLNEKWGDADSGADALELMREVHETILSNDKRWHFFWEGEYTVIRCDPFYANVVKNYFIGFDDFTVIRTQEGYQENIEMTKKYLEAFVPIFHGYSILAVTMEDEDFMGILERINHCYLNMATRKVLIDQFRIPGDLAETHLGMGWEALALQAVAHMRSYTAGWYNR